MIPKAAIEKAIEGGWNGYLGYIASSEESLDQWLKFGGAEQAWAFIALDPLFWEALGRAKGWKDETLADEELKVWLNPEWYDKANMFYDLILTGQSTDRFWKELLSDSLE